MTTEKSPNSSTGGERIAKVMARAGIASRRDAEKMILLGRVSVNGKTIDSPALDVMPHDKVVLDGKPIDAPQETRLWLYYKPLGLVTSERDEKGRRTVFDEMPEGMPRVMTVGRLDLNSEGLLLLTNDGGLKRRLELPETGWLRKYRVRVNGRPEDSTFNPLRNGITIEGEDFQPMEIVLDRQQGANAWLTVGIREGRNREIRRAMQEVGMIVNRLIRVSYGPFRLNEMEPGAVVEVKRKVLRDQLGERLLTGDETAEERRPRSAEERVAVRGAFGDRMKRDADRGDRGGYGDKPRSFGAKSHGDKPAYGDRPRRDEGDRKPYGAKPAFGDKPAYGDRPRRDEGDRKPYGAKPAFGDKPAYGDRPRRDEGDRKPYGAKPAFGDKPAYGDRPRRDEGDRKPYGAKPAFGDKPAYGDRPRRDDGDRKPYGAKPAFGDKPQGARPPRDADAPRKPRWGADKARGERPAEAAGADRGPRSSYGDKPQARSYGAKSHADKPSYGARDGEARAPRQFRKPSEERAERAAGDKPYAPRGDKPYAPRGDKPYAPRGDKPYAPRGDKPYAPRGDKPFAARGDERGAPRGDKSAGFKSSGFKSHGGRDGGKSAGFKSHGGKPAGGGTGGGAGRSGGKPAGRPGPRRD
ncbi:pseudouridine synthase [Phaeovulum sp. W22_SRMD_FR3]|uniref:pseudouridine synthase n=1 Tax=Phaeovulum sp. W22_SRMD_FR3 TaxID=3240274 RepID=UPI003F99DBA4